MFYKFLKFQFFYIILHFLIETILNKKPKIDSIKIYNSGMRKVSLEGGALIEISTNNLKVKKILNLIKFISILIQKT